MTSNNVQEGFHCILQPFVPHCLPSLVCHRRIRFIDSIIDPTGMSLIACWLFVLNRLITLSAQLIIVTDGLNEVACLVSFTSHVTIQ